MTGIPVPVGLTEVADELYALRLEDFVARRNQRAKELRSGGSAGDKEGDKELAAAVAKLAKPSVSAWAVNMLARHADAEVGHVLDLGAALQEALRSLDGAALRDLAQQRQALIAAVVRRAREVAREQGHPIGDAVAAEVEQTLRAAMADADAAAAVRAGRLTAAISSSGPGPLDQAAGGEPSGAWVPATPSPDRTRAGPDADAKGARHEVAAATREADHADRAATAADERLVAEADRVEDAERSKAAIRMEMADLTARLHEAERELTKVEAELEQAARAREEAQLAAAAAAARRAAEQAQQKVRALG